MKKLTEMFAETPYALGQQTEVRVVEVMAVADLSLRGWALAGVIEEQYVRDVQEHMHIPESGYHCGHDSYGRSLPQHVVPLMRSVVLKRPLFAMVRHGDRTREELCSEIAALRNSATNALDKLAERDKELSQSQKDLKVAMEQNRRLQSDLECNRSRLDELEALRRKTETDLAKIREAIGSVRMKEILGEEKS